MRILLVFLVTLLGLLPESADAFHHHLHHLHHHLHRHARRHIGRVHRHVSRVHRAHHSLHRAHHSLHRRLHRHHGSLHHRLHRHHRRLHHGVHRHLSRHVHRHVRHHVHGHHLRRRRHGRHGKKHRRRRVRRRKRVRRHRRGRHGKKHRRRRVRRRKRVRRHRRGRHGKKHRRRRVRRRKRGRHHRRRRKHHRRRKHRRRRHVKRRKHRRRHRRRRHGKHHRNVRKHRHHKKHGNRHHKLHRHHAKLARTHASLAAHHRHMAKHGPRHLRAHHRRMAKHHARMAKHHRRRARRHKRLARHHRRRSRRHVRRARRHRRRARKHRRRHRRRHRRSRRRRRVAPMDSDLPHVRCLSLPDVRSCTTTCRPNAARVCMRSCLSKYKHWGALRRQTRNMCKRECKRPVHQDTCIDNCIQNKKAYAGCLKRPASILSNRQLRRLARRRHHRRRPRRRHRPRHRRRNRCSRTRHELKRSALRARLHRLTAAASACGDTDVQCVDKAYHRIGALKRHIRRVALRFHRRCGGPAPVEHHEALPSCKPSVFKIWLAAQRRKRVHLQKGASRCESDDRHCVRSYMRRLLLVSRSIRMNAKRCNCPLHPDANKKDHEPVECPHWIHASEYRNGITCDVINKKFRKWVKYQRCLRKRYFVEAQRCASDNIPCLRRTYHSIRRIQHKLSHGHDEFGVLIAKCDECAPIKERFRKWLLRQRLRRHRAHLRACACATLDVSCLQDNVLEIKKIQARINLRRHNVLLLHSDCRSGWLNEHQAPGLLPAMHTVHPDDMADIIGDYVTPAPYLPKQPKMDDYKPGESAKIKIPDLPKEVPEAPIPQDEMEEPLPKASVKPAKLSKAKKEGKHPVPIHTHKQALPAPGQVLLFHEKKQ